MLIFCIVMSIISTALLSVFGGFVTKWLDFWIVILLLLGFFVAWVLSVVIFSIIVTIPVNKKKRVDKPSKFYRGLYYFINDFVCDICNIRVKINGLEKLDPTKAYLFVFNHRNSFDPEVILKALRRYDIRFISKPSNMDIPIFGAIAHKSGHIVMERDDDRKAIEAVVRATNYLKQGDSIGLFPEGTRNKNSVDLLPFKNGGFKIAQRGNAPIVVVAVNGTERITKNVPFKRTLVTIDVVKVIPAEEVASAQTTTELGDKIHQLMQDKIDSYK